MSGYHAWVGMRLLPVEGIVEQMDIVGLLHEIQPMYPFHVGSITISLKFVLWHFPILVCSSVCLPH